MKDIAFITTLAGYVHWKLTGEKVLGIGDASGMFPIDSEHNVYDSGMMDTFDILHKEQRGSLYTITARGSREELLAKVNALNPTFCELLPLTLEEIFINETEVAGYDVKKLLF